MFKNYSLGFLFSPDLVDVLLIRKERPAWQQGLLNGVGGHIEVEESPEEAMRREFLEEAGVWVGEWREFCVMMSMKFKMTCFVSSLDFYNKYVTATDEEVVVRKADDLGQDVLSTTSWLVPMAKDFWLTGGDFGGMVVYRD